MNDDMTDLDERLSGEYAALRDTPAVMRSAAGYLEELQGAVIRLGDAIEQGGMPGKLWRSDEADLAALGDIFPLITVDELITRLSQFASERGPAWLRGSMADLAAFRDEARILYDVMHALRVTAQRLRMSGGSGKSQLERAFSNARIGAPLDRVALLLETLDALGPFMAPISPGDWARPAMDDAAKEGFAAFASSPASDELSSPSENQSRGLLRDYAPVGGAGESVRANKSGGLWIQFDIPKAPALLRNRWVLGVAGALLVGALVAFLVVRSPILAGAKKTPTATPPPAVVASADLAHSALLHEENGGADVEEPERRACHLAGDGSNDGRHHPGARNHPRRAERHAPGASDRCALYHRDNHHHSGQDHSRRPVQRHLLSRTRLLRGWRVGGQVALEPVEDGAQADDARARMPGAR